MGIGNDYPVGSQIDHVLGRFPAEEREKLQPAINLSVDIIKSFVLAGIDVTMNQYNKLGKAPKQLVKPINPTEG
jgi:PTH1 family peptidyl-tRNA hydrolase